MKTSSYWISKIQETRRDDEQKTNEENNQMGMLRSAITYNINMHYRSI